MDPTLKSYLLDFVILLAMLGGAALVYLCLLGGLAWLFSFRRGGQPAIALWPSVVLSLVIVVLSVPVFEGIAGLFRYAQPGHLNSPYRQGADLATYRFWTQAAFFALYGFALFLSGVIGNAIRRRRDGHTRRIGLTAALALFLFLLATLPIVDFYNACVVGWSFVLPMSC
jgi:hypothetical protein